MLSLCLGNAIQGCPPSLQHSLRSMPWYAPYFFRPSAQTGELDISELCSMNINWSYFTTSYQDWEVAHIPGHDSSAQLRGPDKGASRTAVPSLIASLRISIFPLTCRARGLWMWWVDQLHLPRSGNCPKLDESAYCSCNLCRRILGTKFVDISLCADSRRFQPEYVCRKAVLFEDRRERSQDQTTSLTGEGAFIICMVRSLFNATVV